MNRMKRIGGAVLAFALLLCVTPAWAEDAVWSYDVNNMYLKLTGELSGDVIVPEQADGYWSSAIQYNAFYGQHAVASLTMPDTLRALGSGAVSGMDGLTSVTLNEGLEYIGSNFSRCGALTSLTIPAGVRVVDSIVSFCENLKEIRFEGACPQVLGADWCFAFMPDDYTIYVPDDQLDAYRAAFAEANGAADHMVTSGKNAVIPEKQDTQAWFEFDAATGTITGYREVHAFVEIPEAIGGTAVKAIGAGAFAGDYSVYGVVCPEGLERIEAGAFSGASNLAYIEFPSTLRTVAEDAFFNAGAKRIVWNEGLETIGDRAFMYLQEAYPALPATLKTIGESAFEGAWCEEVHLSSSIESIGARAFAGSPLRYLILDQDRLIDIAEDAFADTPLADVDLPWDSSIENRDAYAALFAGQCPDCTVWVNNPISGGVAVYPVNDAQTITIENGVWTAYHGDAADLTVWTSYDGTEVCALGEGVFKGNQSIRSFYPHHCGWFTTIGAEAFADSSVEYVELFGSITTLGDGALRNCVNITELTLPASLKSVGAGVLEGCSGLKRLTVLCDPAILPEDMGEVLAQIDELYIAGDAGDEQVRQLSRLAGRAWNCPVPRVGEQQTALVSMPDAPLSGEDFWYDEAYARLDRYNGYELNVIAPREIDGVALTMIGGGMMSRAAAGDSFDVELPVRSLVIPETYTEIPVGAFENCETLETVICYAPLEQLQEGVFAGCTSLREVVFVNGVNEIGRYVFSDCPGLETVYVGPYVGSVSEFAFLNRDQTEAFPQEQCITDPKEMPDVDALLAAVKSEPMPAPTPAPTPEPAMPVGEEGAPYFGTWYGVSMEVDGGVFRFADFGMTMNLTLNEDGTASLFDGEEEDMTTWKAADGIADVQGMTAALQADGTLCLEEDGQRLIFTREGGMPEDAGEGDAESGSAAALSDPLEGRRTEIKFVMTSAEVDGVTLLPGQLGGLTYSLLFHEDGTVEFVMAGSAVPGLTWSRETVMTETGEAEAFAIQWFEQVLYAMLTESGFDLNYFDSMLIHFGPEA